MAVSTKMYDKGDNAATATTSTRCSRRRCFTSFHRRSPMGESKAARDSEAKFSYTSGGIPRTLTAFLSQSVYAAINAPVSSPNPIAHDRGLPETCGLARLAALHERANTLKTIRGAPAIAKSEGRAPNNKIAAV